MFSRSSGELVLFDANSWERNDSNVYELGGEIASLCWLTQTGCLVAAARSMHVYSYISRGGAAATSTSAGSIGVFSGTTRCTPVLYIVLAQGSNARFSVA